MTLAEALQLLAALERHGVAYVLVGSMAMAAQGIVRATRGIDIFVDPREENVARLKAALRQVFVRSPRHGSGGKPGSARHGRRAELRARAPSRMGRK